MSSNVGSFAEAELLSNKAATVELAGDFDAALQLYIRTAQAFLQLSKLATTEREKTRCKAAGNRALERAEAIKTVKKSVLKPKPFDHFSVDEQHYILEKSSRINSLGFPLWQRPSQSEWEGKTFCDSDGPVPLTSSQESKTSSYLRLSKLVSDSQAVMVSDELSPQDIVQNVVTDCSVIASLSVCLEHRTRFGSKLVLSSLFPQDATGMPQISPSGKYICQLMINGAPRTVTVDDYIPITAEGDMISVSTGPKNVLWPIIIEKAYMKLMGGYDFPGSNSSVDLHAIIGWIPEQIYIHSASFEREGLWKRTAQGFLQGTCLVTLGTGERLPATAQSAHLIPCHNYAVTDLTDGDERQLTVVNPWRGSTLPSQSRPGSSSSRPLDAVVRLSWETVCNVFDTIYLNWNPSMFPNSVVHHGSWRLAGEFNSMTNSYLRLRVTRSPQSTRSRSELWVLLTRHIVSKNHIPQFVAMHVVQDDEVSGHVNFRASTSSTSALKPEKLQLRGTYFDNVHVLTKEYPVFGKTGDSVYMTLIASRQSLPDDRNMEEVRYTVTAYSHDAIEFDKTPPPTLHTKKVESSFSTKTSGGNHTFSTFMNNPQWKLSFPTKVKTGQGKEKMHIKFRAECGKDVPLNVKLVWSNNGRIESLTEGDVVADTGAYSYGIAFGDTELTVGDYIVIVSSFSPGQLGDFALTLACSRPFDIKPIPQEGAGMYARMQKGSWDDNHSAGGPSFGNYENNPIYQLVVPTTSKLKLRLRVDISSACVPLNITLFAAATTARPANGGIISLGRQILTSGPYRDSVSGVVTPESVVPAGTYLLVPSTHSPGTKADFVILAWSDAGITLQKLR